jgi:hypothetical protein
MGGGIIKYGRSGRSSLTYQQKTQRVAETRKQLAEALGVGQISMPCFGRDLMIDEAAHEPK